jgi:rubredoxin
LPEEVVNELDEWECLVCGYVYDPATGDPEHGVKPDTPFEKLPEDWVCPVCGASKDQFAKKD